MTTDCKPLLNPAASYAYQITMMAEKHLNTMRQVYNLLDYSNLVTEPRQSQRRSDVDDSDLATSSRNPDGQYATTGTHADSPQVTGSWKGLNLSRTGSCKGLNLSRAVPVGSGEVANVTIARRRIHVRRRILYLWDPRRSSQMS